MLTFSPLLVPCTTRRFDVFVEQRFLRTSQLCKRAGSVIATMEMYVQGLPGKDEDKCYELFVAARETAKLRDRFEEESLGGQCGAEGVEEEDGWGHYS